MSTRIVNIVVGSRRPECEHLIFRGRAFVLIPLLEIVPELASIGAEQECPAYSLRCVMNSFAVFCQLKSTGGQECPIYY